GINEPPFIGEDGEIKNHQSPTRRFDVPTNALDDIRGLWDSDALWHRESDESDLHSCLDGYFYVADACIGGNYALRGYRCGSGRSIDAMWELIQKHFGHGPK